jgi:hypothetical protein
MVRNRTVQVRLTRDQYERMKGNCQVRGFGSLSSFVRFVTLEQDLVLQQKVHEIHHHLLGAKKEPRKKRLGDAPRTF